MVESPSRARAGGGMIGGWIKFEKTLLTDPRFMRMCKAHVTQVRISGPLAATQLVGALVTLWCYADTHIREDDTLDLGADEIDELVGIQGFVALMPSDWLEVLDTHRVKLPGFQEHNGTDAKKKALTQKRVARHRVRNVTQVRSDGEVGGNAGALPDQTRLDQKKNPSAAARPARNVSRETTQEWFLEFKLAYPERAGDYGWRKALKAANARMAEGHTAEEFIAGVKRYAKFCKDTGKTGTEYVKQAATFLGPDKPFLLPWDSPETPATQLATKRAESEKRLLAELRERAGKVGFRDFIEGLDFVGGYETLVKRAESEHLEQRRQASTGPQPISKLIGVSS